MPGQVLGRDKGSWLRHNFSGSLCRDMVLWFQAVTMSQHSLSMSRQNFRLFAMTMLRQRFPCHDQDGHDKRSGYVATELSLLCRDRGFLVTTETVTTRGQAMSRQNFRFSVVIEASLSRLRRSQQEVRLCVFYVAMGLVLARGFLGRDRTFLVATENYQD